MESRWKNEIPCAKSRETIGGFYDGTYARCAIILLLMCVLFMVLGLVLYYPARKLNAAIAKSKEATGVM